jgi:hypothetical protein
MTKIFIFQPILNCFTILESLEKYPFLARTMKIDEKIHKKSIRIDRIDQKEIFLSFPKWLNDSKSVEKQRF